MKTGTIKASWISASPGRRLGAPYWVRVRAAFERLGLDPEGEDNYRLAMDQVKADTEVARASARVLRNQAQAIIDEACRIEREHDVGLI